MLAPYGSANPGTAAILSVSASEEDHVFFESSTRNDSEWRVQTNARWDVQRAQGIGAALMSLKRGGYPVVICSDELLHGTWRELVEQTQLMPDAPAVIVTSHLADDRIWAEAINLGAYDVLVKPFSAREVVPVVNTAWAGWLARQERNRRKQAEKWAVEQWNAAAG